MKWGYVRCSSIPIKTRSGSTWGRWGLLHVLRKFGDEVFVFTEKLNDPFLTNLGVQVTNDYRKAAECDVLIIEGAETLCRPPNYEDIDKTKPVIFQTERGPVLQALKHYGPRNVLLQTADSLSPPLLLGETSSYQYGDDPTIRNLFGKSFLALCEPLDYQDLMKWCSNLRAPLRELTYDHVLFVWNALLTSVYLNNYVKRSPAPFSSRDVSAGYYGIAKNGRFGASDIKDFDGKLSGRVGSLKEVYEEMKKRGLKMKIFTRKNSFSNEFPPEVFEQNEVMGLPEVISRMKASLVMTDIRTISSGYITTRTSEGWFFGTPLCIVPEYGITRDRIFGSLKNSKFCSQHVEFAKIVARCIPRYFETGVTSSWEDFYGRIERLQDPVEFQKEQDKLMAYPAIPDEDVYRLLVCFSKFSNEPMESRTSRYQVLFQKVADRLKERREKGEFVLDNVHHFYFGKKYRRE